MLRCAILDDYQDCALGFADWSSLEGVAVRNFTDPMRGVDAAAAQLADFEIIVAMRERTRFDAALFARLPRLRLLVTTAMRNLAIDLAAAQAGGVTVCGTRAVFSATPEFVWGLLLALARQIPGESAAVRSGSARWQASVGIGLAGKTLGIVGLGKIGGQLAVYARAFGMPVLAWSPHLTDERCVAVGAERAPSLDALLQRADVVTLQMVLGTSTRGMIGARELALLKPTALLLNTARGPLIDEQALIEILRAGRIAGAAIDVYDTEPLPAEHPLRRLPNVVATPHLGYVTRENYQLFYQDAVEDIRAWLASAPLRTLSAAADA
jgi:phosphoglycerate dehydrogenase-like enzyme